jgi:viroplasmin and RNaseH domain-containing protein
MVIVKRKIAFDFKEVSTFNSIEDAKKYCDGIIKRILNKNKKASNDLRLNSLGTQSLPWFMINDKIYNSSLDNRI